MTERTDNSETIDLIEDQDLDSEDQSTPTEIWFDKMDGYLVWKIVGPEINNPFRPKLPDRVLAQLAYDRNMVLALVNVRCLCDGYEVLRIENYAKPNIITDHPCVAAIDHGSIIEYLYRTDVDEQVNKEAERIQIEIRAELEKREKQAAKDGIRTSSAKKKKKEVAPKANTGPRIIRKR